MKRTSVLIAIICFNLVLFFQAFPQERFTPYDALPGIIRSYKPAYSEDLPEWGKMLYQSAINYHRLTSEFETYRKNHPNEKSAIIRYFRIWQRAVEPFVNEDGSISLPETGQYYMNLHASQIHAKESMKEAPAGNSDWSFLGPKETFWLNETGSPTPPGSCPWQVNVYSFDVAASNPGILYCGTETGFVNKTTDKGLHWQQLAVDYPFGGSVTAVAVHPVNEDLVYVAAGNQVHKSFDGGLTWAPLLPAGGQFYADRLRIDPVDPQRIFAAASNGLWVSTNAGSTWSKKWTAPCYDVEIRPNDHNQIYALTRAGSVFSVIQSTDGGSSFQVQSSFPNNVTESSGGLLAMTQANPNLLMAILLSANNTPYLLKGTAAGTSWTWSLQATGQTGAFPMNNGQGYFDLVLDISPVNENIVLVGTTTLYKSLNGGSTFTAVGGYAGNFSIHPDIQDIRMLPNGETWVSTDGGMNLTTDNFTLQANYFVRVNGLMGSDFWGFDQGWNEDLVVGGRYHNGNTSMADFYQPKSLRMGGAESPTGWVMQGKSRHVAFNDLGNGWILPHTATGKPEGRFIFSKYPNMDEYGGRRSNLLHHPNYYGTMYLGEGTGFWKSTDMGITWDLLFNFPARVRYLQLAYSNPLVIYADIVSAGLCRSADGGISWELKPSLTAPPYGNSGWKGKLFFAVSPYDPDVIYACLQNGTWSADIGKVFRSADGGDTWEDWTGSLNEYMKCLVIQPSADEQDLVYLFTNATSGKPARVFYRKPGMPDWTAFDNDYPAGMTVNLALPFFRDARIRVGGTGSVWESPMADTAFKPIINPWIGKSFYPCMTDTLFFEDHSMLKHNGTAWHWDISPQPLWIDNPDIRNPKVVLGTPGSYDVTLTVTHNGQTYAKTIAAMVTTTTCPSIYDCNNPAELPKDEWSLVYVDSEEINDPGLAVMSFDRNPSTIWHTRWSTGNDPYPHEIQIDMGAMYRVYKFTYLNRQDSENGRISDYELYISDDTLSWGVPAHTGKFENTAAPQTIQIDTGHVGRYFRLLALSEVNGNPWASAAEFTATGCVEYPAGAASDIRGASMTAFPVPTNGRVTVSLPWGDRFDYEVVSASGAMVDRGVVPIAGSSLENHSGTDTSGSHEFDLTGLKPGIYLIVLKEATGDIFRVKVVKR